MESSPREKWSFLLVGSRGRVLRLHLGWGLAMAVGFVFFMLLMISGALYLFKWEWDFGDKYAFYGGLEQEIQALQRENKRLMARVASLEITLENPDTYFGEEDSWSKVWGVSEQGEVSIPEVIQPKKMPPELTGAPPVPEVDIAFPMVTLDSYRAGIRGETYGASFNIRNIRNDAVVSGYIVSVLIPKEPSFLYPASPAMEVQNGRPMDPKRGQFFSIRNFKDVRLRFGHLDPDLFQANRIFVFNEAGALMHVEDFEVVDNP
ncbi:bZIP transcription factor [Desulfobotulus mexicanus]|uniref:BZIP transcription factor n=2 Tax=Desulfobotulus mexicanus TaxID=2586642 RepID=A0A5Q4VBJ4_9BACT|nr:bZIP transcription factor [Desulfobotulus mexicanus]